MEASLEQDLEGLETQWSCQKLVESPGTKLLAFSTQLTAIETSDGATVALDEGWGNTVPACPSLAVAPC